MARPASLKPTSTGIYYRQVGYTETRSQPRFNLGTDKVEAGLRSARLEQLWRLVCERHESIHGLKPHTRKFWDREETKPPPPSWDDLSLAIARSVADGAPRFVLAPNPEMQGADSYRHWVARCAEAYGSVIPIVPSDPDLHAEGVRAEESARQAYLLEVVQRATAAYPTSDEVRLPTGQTVHQAYSAYREHVRTKHRDDQGRVTEWGETLSGWIDYVRGLTPDCDLSDFGLAAIDHVIEAVRSRPQARTHAAKGRAKISRKFATNLLKAFRPFIRWLHRSEQFKWRRPDDYEVTPVTIPKTDDERAKSLRSVQVASYTREELVTLWRYASPMERVLMALALNCAFGQRELATCRLDEIHRRCVHPHALLLGMASSNADSWVMRLRTKTDVYGEWQLWPTSVAAVDWYTARRPASESPLLLLTAGGRGLTERTAGNNSNRYLSNAWADLTSRVRKDYPDFRKLSFNKIRKTGINFIRKECGGELASLFAAHGRPFETDNLIEVYSNKPFGNLHKAIDGFRDWLQPVWDAVPAPFPSEWTESVRRGGPNISRGRIDKIIELHTAGKRIADIVRETGLSRETVRRWITRTTGEKPCST